MSRRMLSRRSLLGAAVLGAAMAAGVPGDSPATEREAMAGPAASPTRAAEAPAPVHVLVVGDSLALGYAAALERVLAPASDEVRYAEVERLVTVGAGVIPRPRRDLESDLEERIAAAEPAIDIVVIAAGVNDVGMPLGGASFYGETWTERYRERVAALAGIAAARGLPTFWVGLPDVPNPNFASVIERTLRPAQEVVLTAADSPATYIPTRALATGDAGGHGQGLARSGDGVHFSAAGYTVIARRIVAEIERVTDRRLRPGEPSPPVQVADLPPVRLLWDWLRGWSATAIRLSATP